LMLVGHYEEDLNPLLEKTSRSITHNPGIIMCGFKDDVRPYLALADVFVFPSYREGFPNVVLQACSFNLACIVTDINGNNEIIQSGVNGLIVQPKSSIELYEAMEILLCNRELRKKLAEKGRTLICEKYNQSYLWQELLTLYRNLSG